MKKKIINFLENKLTTQEGKKVINEIKNNLNNLSQYSLLKSKKTVQDLKKPHLQEDTDIAFNTINKQLLPKHNYTFLKIASIIILILTLSNYFIDKSTKLIKQELYSENAITKEIVLADGSIVQLNKHSHLEYSNFKNSKTRDVYLTGEAFFKVSKNINKPFIVHTKGIDIKVLGTSFNVKSNTNSKYIETSLYTGKVVIMDRNKAISVLHPNEMLTYDLVSKKAIKTNCTTSKKTDWRVGVLSFNNTPLKEVIKELEKEFDVSIILSKNIQLSNYSFTGKFRKNTNIKSVLETLKITLKIDYSIHKKTILLK